MKWTLIFTDGRAGSVQVYHVEGEPMAAARALKASEAGAYLREQYALVAAVAGHHQVLTRDDAHSFDECTVG